MKHVEDKSGMGNNFWLCSRMALAMAWCLATLFMIPLAQAQITVTCAPDQTVECGSAWNFTAPAATTTCPTPDVTIAVLSTTTNFTGCGQTFTATRIWSVTDACDNSNSCSQTVTVQDTTIPVINCAADKSVEYGSAWSFDPPAASDNCVFDTLIYDDSVHDLSIRFDPGINQVGDEIILGGTARYLTSFTLEYWGTNLTSAQFEGAVTARLRFHAQDGPLFNNYPSPGTVLYDSGDFPVSASPRATLTFNDFVSQAVVPLTGPLPTSFTWSIQFSGLGANDRAGLDVFSPPVVGQDYPDYWQWTDGAWQLRASQDDSPLDFAAQAYASNRLQVIVVNTVTNYNGCAETYTATRTWQATDPCGNSSTCSQTVTVIDTTRPEIICSPNKAVECGSDWTFDPPTASDNCVFDTLIYDDSVNDLSLRFEPGTNEVGDEIILGGTARYLSSFTLEYWGTNTAGPAFEGPVTARVRFYDTNGALYHGYASPGTVLFDSGDFPVGPTVRSTLTFNDFVTGAVVPLTVALPNAFTWSIQFSGMTANDHVGIDVYSPPVVGQDYPDYWLRVGDSWELRENENSPVDFAALAYASHRIEVVVVSTVTNAAGCGQSFTATRTWRATDPCGNSSTCSQVVTVQDTTAPTLTLPPVVANTEAGTCSALVAFTVTAVDTCNTVSSECLPPSGSRFPIGPTTVNCAAWDACNNTNRGSFTVTVVDNILPTVTAPNIVTNLTTGCSLAVTFTPTAADNCAVASVSCSPASGSLFPAGATTVICTARDASGNTGTGSFTVTVQDAVLPSFDLLNVVTNVTSGCSQIVNFTTNVSDNCSLASVSCTHGSGSSFPVGATTVSCTAYDITGNSRVASFTVTVLDQLAPTVTCPANITTNVTSGCAQVVTFTPTAADNCSVASVACNPASGSVFAVGTNSVTCTAYDVSGNPGSCTFSVIVRDPLPPVFACPANMTSNLLSGCSMVIVYPTNVSDNCTLTNVTCNPPSGSAFSRGTTNVFCVARDASGNSNSCSFTVTIYDPIPPTIVCPENIITNTGAGCNQIVTFTPTALDNCAVTNISCIPSNGATFVLGTTNVTCVAKDSSGNSNTCTFSVTVRDTLAPSLVCLNITTNTTADSGCSQIVNFTPVTFDNCSVASVVCTPPSGSSFALGNSLVTCGSADPSGNSNTCTFTVSVVDTTLPAITAPNIITNTTGLCSQVVQFSPTASDNCTLASVACTPPSGSTFALGNRTVTCAAWDARGNSNTCTFTVTVLDTDPPLPNVANITTNAGKIACQAIVNYVPTALDNCSVTSVVCTPPSGTRYGAGTFVVNCTARDASGNTGTNSFEIRVVDPYPPTVNCPASIVTNATAGCAQNVNFTVSASDNCGVTNLFCMPPSGSSFALGTNLVRCTALDRSANSNSCTFTITVLDTLPPVVVCPANVVTNTTGGGNAVVEFNATATDNCTLTNLVCTPASGSVFSLGTTTVTCRAFDDAGNAGQCSFTVTVLDREPPVLANCPANISWPADPTGCGAVVTWVNPTATDNDQATVTCQPSSGSFFAVGASNVLCFALDPSGNSNGCTFTVTVQDTTAPTACANPPIIFAAGDTNDNFSGPEPSSPSPGQLIRLSGADLKGFDDINTDSWFAHSFTDLPNHISEAKLRLKLRACGGLGGAPGNDTIMIGFTDNNGSLIPGEWGRRLGTDGAVGLLSSNWSAGMELEFVLNLAQLPNLNATVNDLIPGMNKYHMLDVYLQDDTAVDYVILEIKTCQVQCNMVVPKTPGQNGAVVNYTLPVFTDSCDPNPGVTCQPPSGSFMPIGMTFVQCTAIDQAGNRGHGSFRVFVEEQPGSMNLNLRALRQGADAVLRWAATCDTYVVEQSSALTTPMVWEPLPGTPTLANEEYSLPVTPTGHMRYFRLRKQ